MIFFMIKTLAKSIREYKKQTIITPILVGIIMDFNAKGQRLLFVYSSIMMILAIGVFILKKKTL